ncbi:MAG: response regulator transcription factor [Gaiellales bacterium]
MASEKVLGSEDGVRDVKVVLVDDHAVVRAGLRMLIEQQAGLHVVGEAGTGAEALEIVEIKRPDVVVLDVELPDADGLELLPQLQHKTRNTARFLILSMHDDPDRVQRAFAAGASGYLIKDAAEGELITAIETIQDGEQYLYPPLGASLMRAASQGPKDPLTDRERDIARLLALGHTNQEAATQLYLSVRTIETHRAHVMGKLRLQSRAELTRWALANGLLDDVTASEK